MQSVTKRVPLTLKFMDVKFTQHIQKLSPLT